VDQRASARWMAVGSSGSERRKGEVIRARGLLERKKSPITLGGENRAGEIKHRFPLTEKREGEEHHTLLYMNGKKKGRQNAHPNKGS